MKTEILQGDCRAMLATLPERWFHCCVTSPPYWGLRDYGLPPVEWEDGWGGCLGLEPAPEQFITHIVEVFRQVKRVLRDDGVLWVNLGDNYAGSGRGGYFGGSTGQSRRRDGALAPRSDDGGVPGLKTGDLCNMPHRVATALQADGWFWRSTIIWAKRSPMPESLSGWRWVRCRVKVGRKPVDWAKSPKGWDHGEGSHDQIAGGNYRTNGSGRVPTVAVYEPCPGCSKCEASGGYILRRGKWRPTTAHEYMFMFSKSERYFCDGDAVQEISIGERNGSRGANGTPKGSGKKDPSNQHAIADATEMRNPRSVWTLSTEPYKAAHFATFPIALASRCIQASTSAKGCCPQCGSPHAPIVESDRIPTRPALDNKIWKHQEATNGDGKRSATLPNLDPERHVVISRVVGYRPTCKCGAESTVPCRAIDIFNGAGTTAVASRRLGVDYTGCELNPDYIEMTHKRLRAEANRGADLPKIESAPGQQTLFA